MCLLCVVQFSVGYQAMATRSHIVHGVVLCWLLSGLELSSPARPHGRIQSTLFSKQNGGQMRTFVSGQDWLHLACFALPGLGACRVAEIMDGNATHSWRYESKLAPCRDIARWPPAAQSIVSGQCGGGRHLWALVRCGGGSPACHKPCQTTWCCSCCVVFDILQKIHFDGLGLKNSRMTNFE